MLNRCVLLLLAAASAINAKDLIGAIDFYGYKGIDVAKVRASLPVHVGEPYSEKAIVLIREAVEKAIGTESTDVRSVCCNEQGDQLIYVGLPGESYRRFEYNPQPTGRGNLPAEIGELYDKERIALVAAVRKGGDASQEDDSQGYMLLHDPDARALELQFHAWAVDHPKELVAALDFASARDRQIASVVLGYANQSKETIDALVRATRDPDDDVRDESTRALGVLIRSGNKMAAEIPIDGFIAMLNSGVWTDRNKGALVIWAMTESRKPELMAKLRAEALDSLIEMASWTWNGHAFAERVILGRMAGMEDQKIYQIALSGSPAEIIEVVRKQ